MSGQQSTPCRVPKTPPNSGKQGPLKATIPISGVIKQSSNVRSGISPVSPFSWKSRGSPDHVSGQRSPGSSSYKGKSKYSGGPSEVMRRTASLDTIYLKGHWPKDHFYWGYMGILQFDKATQTEDIDWKSHYTETEEKLSLRPKIRGNKESTSRHISPGDNTLNNSSQTLTSCMLSLTSKVSIPIKPLPKSSIRSSVEGLNQEIERIVLRTGSDGNQTESLWAFLSYPDVWTTTAGIKGDEARDEVFTVLSHCLASSLFIMPTVVVNKTYECHQATPEGHRAPLAEMLRSNRSRSVNTQTPQDFSHSSGSSSRESLSPPRFLRRPGSSGSSDEGESHGSSPDNEASKLGTSPHINRFLAREPPDGCEKVRLKSLDDKTNILLEHAPQPSTFKLRPSLGSAFKILQPALSPSEEQVEPFVPQGD